MVLHSEPHWPSESCSTSCQWISKSKDKIPAKRIKQCSILYTLFQFPFSILGFIIIIYNHILIGCVLNKFSCKPWHRHLWSYLSIHLKINITNIRYILKWSYATDGPNRQNQRVGYLKASKGTNAIRLYHLIHNVFSVL